MLYSHYYYWYSALGPVWAETRAQSGDWYGSGTLHAGQILRCSLPLLSPAFGRSHFRHQVPHCPPRHEKSQRRKWELWARMLSGNFAEMTTSTPFTCRKSTTWDRRLYFPSEGRRAEDFYALKNPMASAGFEPANLGTKGQHATPRPLLTTQQKLYWSVIPTYHYFDQTYHFVQSMFFLFFCVYVLCLEESAVAVLSLPNYRALIVDNLRVFTSLRALKTPSGWPSAAL